MTAENKLVNSIFRENQPTAELKYLYRLDKKLFKGNPLELTFAGTTVTGGTFEERLERSPDTTISDFKEISECELLNLIEEDDEAWVYRLDDRDIVSLASHEAEGTLFLTPGHVDVRAFRKLATTKFIRL